MGNEEKLNPEEGIWADPEAILRPREGERLTSLIEEFENERYPLMMAHGWINQALERLPQNQALLKGLLNESQVELAGLTVAFNIGMDQARQMISECTGEPARASDPRGRQTQSRSISVHKSPKSLTMISSLRKMQNGTP